MRKPPYLFLATLLFSVFPVNISRANPEKIAEAEIPVENRAAGNSAPAVDTAETLARELLSLLKAPELDESAAKRWFFPEAPFLLLKDIPDAKAYHGKLLEEYANHLRRHKTFVQRVGELEYVGFHRGFCKWKPKGSEYNKIPYWSCYRSKILTRDASGKQVELPVKVIINWGKEWTITHLGLPPAEGASVNKSPGETSDKTKGADAAVKEQSPPPPKH